MKWGKANETFLHLGNRQNNLGFICHDTDLTNLGVWVHISSRCPGGSIHIHGGYSLDLIVIFPLGT